MAEEVDVDVDQLLSQNAIMDSLHERVRIIVKDIGCKAKLDVAEKLETEISLELIKDSREIVFNAAVDKYNTQLSQNNIQGKPNLQLILRRGDTAGINCAADIVELLLYVCNVTDVFPKSTISMKNSTYIDIKVSDNTSNVEQCTAVESNDNKSLNQRLNTIEDNLTGILLNYDSCKKELQSLKNYVLDIEKIHMEQITLLKNELSALKGLISGQQMVRMPSQPATPGEAVSSGGIAVNGNGPTHSQPAHSGAAVTNSDQEDPTISELLERAHAIQPSAPLSQPGASLGNITPLPEQSGNNDVIQSHPAQSGSNGVTPSDASQTGQNSAGSTHPPADPQPQPPHEPSR